MLAFDYAVDIWSVLLTSDVTVRIDAFWTDLGAGALAQAGPSNLHQNFANAPISETYYPAALANALAGEDLSEQSDLECTFNSTANWYRNRWQHARGHLRFCDRCLARIGARIRLHWQRLLHERIRFWAPPTSRIRMTISQNANSVALLDLRTVRRPWEQHCIGSHLLEWGQRNGGRRRRTSTVVCPGKLSSRFELLPPERNHLLAGNPQQLDDPRAEYRRVQPQPRSCVVGHVYRHGMGHRRMPNPRSGNWRARRVQPDSDTYTQALVLTYLPRPPPGSFKSTAACSPSATAPKPSSSRASLQMDKQCTWTSASPPIRNAAYSSRRPSLHRLVLLPHRFE